MATDTAVTDTGKDSLPTTRPRSPLPLVGAAVLAIGLCCLPFCVTVVPPMADVPAHVLVARIITQHDNPQLRFADYFDVDWNVAPTVLTYVALASLQQAVPPYWDARIYLVVWVIGTFASVWYLSKVRGEQAPECAALAALPLTFSWYAYKGFLPFLMSLPLFAATVAVWFDDWKPSVKIALLWALTLLLFGFHIVGAAAAGAVICAAAAMQAIKERHSRPLVRAGVALTPLLLVTCTYLLGHHSPNSAVLYRDLLTQLVDVIKFTCGTLDNSAAALLLAWLGGLGLVLVVRFRDLVAVPPLLAGAVLLAILSVVLPGSLGSLWPAGPRLLPFSLILLIGMVKWSRIGPMRVAVACLLLLAGVSAFTTRQALRIDAGFTDVRRQVATLPAGKRLLPVIDQSVGSRWTTPYMHVGTMYTMERGGSNPYVLAAPHVLTAATPITFRHASDASRFAFMYDPARGPEDYRGVSEYYDYVLLWGAFPSIAQVLDAEMDAIYRSGEATLYSRRSGRPPKAEE